MRKVNSIIKQIIQGEVEDVQQQHGIHAWTWQLPQTFNGMCEGWMVSSCRGAESVGNDIAGNENYMEMEFFCLRKKSLSTVLNSCEDHNSFYGRHPTREGGLLQNQQLV